MTEDEIVNFAVERGLRDIYILRQPTPKGIGIAAGIPWYSAPFGRDSAITGWQLLPYRIFARECIELLGAYQGTKVDESRAERPGKIMHELRFGEMTRTWSNSPHSLLWHRRRHRFVVHACSKISQMDRRHFIRHGNMAETRTRA